MEVLASVLGLLFLLVGIFWIIQSFLFKEVNELWWLLLVAGATMVGDRALDLGPAASTAARPTTCPSLHSMECLMLERESGKGGSTSGA
jgi:hypothetical protein